MVISMSEYNNVPKIRFKGFTDVWEQRKLGDECFELIAGGDIDKTSSVNNGKYPIYANALTNDGIVGYYNDSYRVKSPAVTITGRGEIGYAMARNTDFTPVVRLISLRSKHNNYFLANAINLLNVVSESTGVPQLTIPQVEKFDIYFPKNINEEIKLGRLFNEIDNLITLHQRKYDSLVNVKKSLLEKMFPKNSSNIPEIRFKGFTDVWEQRKFIDFGTISMCKRIFKDETSENGDIPFYKIGTFGDKADAFISNEKYEFYKLKFSYPNKGDILLSASGTIGRIVEYKGEKAYFQDSNIVWLNHNDKIKNCFLKVLYPTVKWDGIEGSTIKRLYNSNFLNTEIMVPDTKEQNKIGELFTNIDNLITLHQRKLEKLNNIKKSMLDKMFV